MSDDAAVNRQREADPTGEDSKRQRLELIKNDDVIAEVLLRLPVKSLIRFQSVCKSWRALIFSSYFVNRHLRRVVTGRNKSKSNLLLPGSPLRSVDYDQLLKYFMTGDLKFDYPVLLFRNVKELLISDSDIEVGLIDWPKSIVPKLNSVKIYGSCDGLVCVEFDSVNILIWNPYTGEVKLLPKPNVRNGGEFYGFGYAWRSIGYGYSGLDFKVARGSWNEVDGTVMEVFSLKTGLWRRCRAGYVLEGQGCWLNGALHWVQLERDECKSIVGAKIVKFNLADEKFKEELQCPDPLVECDECYCSVGIGVIGECLTVCIEPYESDLSIWKMEEYGVKESWTRVASIARGALPKEFKFRLRPLRISENGEVFMNLDRNVLALYSSEEKRFKAVVWTHEHVSFDTAIYAESLVSPVTGNLNEQSWEERITRRHRNTSSLKLLLPVCPFYSVDFEALLKHLDKVVLLGSDYLQIQNLSQLISGDVAIRESDCPVKVSKNSVQIYGSCNGLICLEVDCDKIILWNPCTGDSKLLPEATRCAYYQHPRYYGFGYDSRNRDYKVIRGYFETNYAADEDETKFEVFTLKTGSWRQDLDSLSVAGQGCLVNDALHWVEHECDNMGYVNDSKIVSFNLRDERFQEEVSLPILPPHSREYESVEVGAIEDCLCICVEPIGGGLRVWVMKEYGVKESWTEVLNISGEIIPQDWEILSRPLSFLENGEVLLKFNRNVLALYNPERDTLRTVAKTHEDRQSNTAFYVETLVSPATGCDVGM